MKTMPTYSDMRTPGQRMADVIGAPRWFSSIVKRMPPLVAFVHGISTKRMECGSFFCGMLFFIGGKCADVDVLAIDDGVAEVDADENVDGTAVDVDATDFSNGCIWRR